jgi:uncharacterized protein
MARLLFWIVLAGLVYAVARNWSRRHERRARAADKPAESMIACAACGLNVPQSEARLRDGLWYCSPEHLERGPPGG